MSLSTYSMELKKRWLSHSLRTIRKQLLIRNILRLIPFDLELSLLEVADNHTRQEFIHPLFIRNIRISPAPNEQQQIEQFRDGLILEEVHLLVSPFYVFVDFLFEELVGFLHRTKSTIYLLSWGLMGPIMSRGFFLTGYLMGDFLLYDFRAYYFF